MSPQPLCCDDLNGSVSSHSGMSAQRSSGLTEKTHRGPTKPSGVTKFLCFPALQVPNAFIVTHVTYGTHVTHHLQEQAHDARNLTFC